MKINNKLIKTKKISLQILIYWIFELIKLNNIYMIKNNFKIFIKIKNIKYFLNNFIIFLNKIFHIYFYFKLNFNIL